MIISLAWSLPFDFEEAKMSRQILADYWTTDSNSRQYLQYQVTHSTIENGTLILSLKCVSYQPFLHHSYSFLLNSYPFISKFPRFPTNFAFSSPFPFWRLKFPQNEKFPCI